MSRARHLGLAGAILALTLTGCAASTPPSTTIPPRASTAPSTPPSAAPETPEATFWQVGAAATLAQDLAAPWSVVPLEDGGALVSQRDDGLIVHVGADGTRTEVGTVPDVVPGGEAGLHGLALRTEGGDTWLYAYHGASDDNRVVRMPLLGDAGSYSLGEVQVVFDGIDRAGNHNGGRIAFGPDGMLYVATGDAGDTSRSQDEDSPNGKILRLTPEGDPAAGNPTGTAVWSLGHRNVQGIAWTTDGVMWASEFGQNTWDELNRIEPGANYGWPDVEGDSDDERFVAPVAVWATDEASPSGIAAVGQTVFMTGLRGERLWLVDTAGGELVGEPRAALEREQGRLRDAIAAPDGSLWVLTNNTDGRGSARDGDDLLLRLPLVPAE